MLNLTDKIQLSEIVIQRNISENELQQQHNIIQIYNKYLNMINLQIKQSEDIVKSQIKLNIVAKAIQALTTAHAQCPNIAASLNMVNIILIVTFSMISLLFIVGLFNICTRLLSCGVGFIAFLLVSTLATVVFITLIIGSDFCLSSKKLLHEYISENSMTDYYLYCHHRNNSYKINSLSNVVLAPFEEAQMKIFSNVSSSINSTSTKPEQIDELFYQVKHFVNICQSQVQLMKVDNTEMINQLCSAKDKNNNIQTTTTTTLADLCKYLVNIDNLLVGTINNNISCKTSQQNSMLAEFTMILNTVETMLETVECNKVADQIDDTLTTVCTTLYESMSLFLINYIFSIICFYILLLICIWKIAKAKADKIYYDYDEYSPAHRVYRRKSSWNHHINTGAGSNKTTVL